MGKTASKQRRNNRHSPWRKALNSHFLWLGVGIALIVAGILAFAIPAPTEAAEVDASQYAAPDFRLANLDNEQIRLADYRGQYVLVNFWATWCPPCRAELPDLASFYHDHSAGGFTFLAVNEQETAQIASAYLDVNRLDFPVLLDPDGATMERYGVTGLPSSFLIAPNGDIVRRWSGMINRRTLENEVTPLLAAAS
jgi:peroxiredoxin